MIDCEFFLEDVDLLEIVKLESFFGIETKKDKENKYYANQENKKNNIVNIMKHELNNNKYNDFKKCITFGSDKNDLTVVAFYDARKFKEHKNGQLNKEFGKLINNYIDIVNKKLEHHNYGIDISGDYDTGNFFIVDYLER